FDTAQTLAEALLTPTRIYVKPILAALRAGIGIKALAHITGGGFVDNIPRVLPDDMAARSDLGAVAVPHVFGWLARSGGIAEREMLRTFNCGVGMIAVLAPAEAEALVAHLAASGEQAAVVGELVPRTGEAVLF